MLKVVEEIASSHEMIGIVKEVTLGERVTANAEPSVTHYIGFGGVLI